MHGGDIYRNDVELDFSVNINSKGIPDRVKEALKDAIEKCTCYPDIQAERLKKAIAQMNRIDEQTLVFGNGASELFLALIRALKPKKALIPVPSFYGYEKALASSQCETIYYEMKEEENFCLTERFLEQLTDKVDVLFLTNPNNPVGNCVDRVLLEKIIQRCNRNNITVILDECFIEFTEEGQEGSFMHKTKRYPNVIVVRAFTKIFSIPGVRLGYLICQDHQLKKKILDQLPEWNLSVFAQEAGYAATKETEFIKETISATKKEREYLIKELKSLGIKVYEGRANFLLLYTEENLAEKLLEKKILIRDCSNFRGLKKGFYRIAVKKREENIILIKEIKKIMEKKGQV